MSEKKETQYVVMRHRLSGANKSILIARNWANPVGTPTVWFDGRQAARDYARRMNARSNTFAYKVVPIKRGPRS